MAGIERTISVWHEGVLAGSRPRDARGRFVAYRQSLDAQLRDLISEIRQVIQDGSESIYPWLRDPWGTFDDTDYPAMRRIQIGVASHDPLVSVFEFGSGPAAGEPSYWPPFGEDSRLWEWVQRQDGNAPSTVRDQNASARALLAARKGAARDQHGRLTGTPLPRQTRIAGRSAFPVARAIHDRGTYGRFEMGLFWSEILERWQTAFSAIIEEVMRRAD